MKLFSTVALILVAAIAQAPEDTTPVSVTHTTVLVNPGEVHFSLAVQQVESGFKDNAIGDQGRSFGRFQIQKAYMNEGGVPYKHADMFDLHKANLTFWATMEKYSKEFYAKEKRLPTYTELARMHNGGPTGYRRESTFSYQTKFEHELQTFPKSR